MLVSKVTPQIKALAIDSANQLPFFRGMVKTVFKVKTTDGMFFVGSRYEEKGVKIGDLSHFDSGSGINKNQDAEIIWVSEI